MNVDKYIRSETHSLRYGIKRISERNYLPYILNSFHLDVNTVITSENN